MPDPTLQSFLTGLAHEINQPLTTLSMTASMLELLVEEGQELDSEKLQNRLRRITREVDRIADILDHVRDLGRCDPSVSPEPVLPGQVVSRVLALLGAQLNAHNIQIDVHVEGPSTPVLAQPQTLEWLLLETLIQRMMALDSSGLTRKEIAFTIATSDGGVTLEITDNGPELDTAALIKRWEPVCEWGVEADLQSSAGAQRIVLHWP